jgi:hypothetical protein
MRFIGGTYHYDVDETLLTDAQRAAVRALAAAGHRHRAQQLAESYELRAIRAALDEQDDRRLTHSRRGSVRRQERSERPDRSQHTAARLQSEALRGTSTDSSRQ